LQRWERPVIITDHGALTGLGDDDHTQYLLRTDKAADSDKLDGVDSTGFVNTNYDQAISGTKYFNAIPVVNADPTLATHVVRKSYADASYLGVSAKAADSDKLDGVDSTGFVNTTSAQTVGGTKTFSDIPVLPSSNPTLANQAVRKGYADSTYLGISAKAADSDKLDGVDITAFKGLNSLGDPLRDRLLFWDDSAKALMWLDAGTGLTIDGTTITSSPARYFVKAYRSTAFSIASGSVTIIPLNAEEFDTHAQHDNTTNPSRLTCKKAGLYVITGTITFNATASSAWNMSIRKNNTTDIVRETTIASSGGVYVTATVLIPLAENDYIEMQGWHGLGSSVDLVVTNNYNVQLSMARISD